MNHYMNYFFLYLIKKKKNTKKKKTQNTFQYQRIRKSGNLKWPWSD